MEDDDEFGDLYTDVLQPFSSSLSSAPHPHHPSPAPPPPPRPIDLNLNKHDNEILSRRDLSTPSNQNSVPSGSNSARVLTNNEFTNKPSDSAPLHEDKDVKFDIEEEAAAASPANTGIIEDSAPVIPGLSVGDSTRNDKEAADVSNGRGGGRDEDWDDDDSDSEDDLKIVLNDTSHGQIGMDRGGVMGDDDDDDEDGDPLVIVADGDANQGMEEQDWGMGEDAGAAADGERKEGEGAAKGSAVAMPKIGYSNHGYHHPFHSQFKYVRPGAAPIPGPPTVGPGGGPGQVRPSININPMVGRGRGDWRPTGIKGSAPMQKGYPGFGMSAWGGSMGGRGFGGGLEFTLPSHKTIFDVDIDSFEEKPWKYPGVEITDFFNFGLNEESWKEYCKHLEQHRLETTMQSKIRVYESGRAEQDYDPDMPPELAAAAGLHDLPVDKSNLGKSDVGQSDLAKGSTRVRPPIPTGRPIQVETSYSERLPSIDTRPPRNRDRDCDAIEIVLQDSVDDDYSTGNAAEDGVNNGPSTDDFRGNHVTEDDLTPRQTEHFDDFPHDYNRKIGKRAQYVDSNEIVPDEEGNLPFQSKEPSQHRPGSRRQPPVLPEGEHDSHQEERRRHSRMHERSPDATSERSTQNKRFLGDAREESVESMGGKDSPTSSPTARDARELSTEDKDSMPQAEGSSGMERDEMTENDTLKDGESQHFSKKQKVNSCVEQPTFHASEDGEDSKAARSSENSKGRSGSSKEYQKWHDGVEEEVVQDRNSVRSGSIKRHLDETEHDFRRKDRDTRKDMEKNRMVIKGREDSYPHRDLDPSLVHHLQLKNEGYDRRRERENPDGSWQRRDEDSHSRRNRTEETRKKERGDEIGSSHRSKMRESERSDKDEHLHSRKQLENSSYRVHYDKDGSARHRERDDSLKTRYEVMDDYHGKRRKEEEYMRRDHADKEEILHGYRESGRRRRERDDLDPRKRDDQQRIRDNFDDYIPVGGRHKDEVWLQRERGERQRDREDLYRLKPSYEESLSKREREDGRSSMRSGRGTDDKGWIGHSRMKDEYKGSDKEYQLKDAVRNSDKRRDRMEDESFSHHRGRDDVYARGNQSSNDDRRSKQDRSSNRIDRAVDGSNNQRVNDKKHKESMRKNKEFEGGDPNPSGSSRRNEEEKSVRSDDMGLKGTIEEANGDNEISAQRNSSKRHREDLSSDEEQQDSRRGRSKLERWTSHKERDFSIGSKSSSSLKYKDMDKSNAGGSSDANTLPKDLPKRAEAVEKKPQAEDKGAGNAENKDATAKPLEDRHFDTVEKLKKRSERFKLPMPIEKDASVIKKMESEALPPTKPDTTADSEIKPERPARKRRWISS